LFFQDHHGLDSQAGFDEAALNHVRGAGFSPQVWGGEEAQQLRHSSWLTIVG
jgi:hypothetical protein